LPGKPPRAIEAHANEINCVQPWQSLLGHSLALDFSPARNPNNPAIDRFGCMPESVMPCMGIGPEVNVRPRCHMTGTRTGGLWVPRSMSPHATWAYFVDQPTEPISPQDAGFAASSRMDRVDWRTRVSQPSEWVVDSGQSRSCRWRGGPVSACVSMKLLDQEPCRVCDVVAFPVAADLVQARWQPVSR
jgi:hypothetical protein